MPDLLRHLFGRVTLWEPTTRTILDLSARQVLAAAGPSSTEERTAVASGGTVPVRRAHEVRIPITEDESAGLGKMIARSTAGRVRAAFLGRQGAESWMWQELTPANLQDPESEALTLGARELVLQSNVFHAGIGRGHNLLDFAPWRNEEETGGTLGPAGYEAPGWEVEEGNSVGPRGVLSSLDSPNPAEINFQFPCWGADVVFEAAGRSTLGGVVVATDRTGAYLDDFNDGEVFTVPRYTWTLRLGFSEQEAVDSNASPVLRLVRPGRGLGLIVEPWEDLGIDVDNEAPVWEDREDVVLVPASNSAPDWEDKDNVTVFK